MSTVLLLFALQLLLVSAKSYYDVALNNINNTQILGVTPFADMKVIKKAYYQVRSSYVYSTVACTDNAP